MLLGLGPALPSPFSHPPKGCTPPPIPSNPRTSPVDRLTWEEDAVDLETRLAELHGRLHRGAYRALPSRRRYVPKSDGGQRPLGIAALEDKIVQTAVVAILTPIYEAEFLGFSYGFRP
ncbi:MAG TPA: hypothetical protein VHF45_13410, partial [Thermoleophilaceae bacterium]|nr:hypothetical protein [Thermoleophilaceae bacterium]